MVLDDGRERALQEAAPRERLEVAHNVVEERDVVHNEAEEHQADFRGHVPGQQRRQLRRGGARSFVGQCIGQQQYRQRAAGLGTTVPSEPKITAATHVICIRDMALRDTVITDSIHPDLGAPPVQASIYSGT